MAVVPATSRGGGTGLPSQWTQGAHGNVTATVDADVVPLTIQAELGQTANLTEWRDETGTLQARVEFDGGVSNFNSFQVRPLAAFTSGVQVQPGGGILQKTSGSDAWVAESGSDPYLRLREKSPGGLAVLEVDRDQGQPGVYVGSYGVVENPADAIQAVSALTGNNAFRVLGAGAIVTAQQAAPADADLANGELALWFDPTPGASKLMVKAKDSGGTVRTAAIALA